jgi:thioredoxin reductase
MTGSVEVAIVGAGPYGLSIAAHLRGRADFRIFGRPMQSWRESMPAGMHLKSDGFASDLYDPGHRMTLERYCANHHLSYHPLESPVPLETFVAYGQAFQAECVPMLEQRLVTKLTREGDGFGLMLDDGSVLTAHRVVIATGITHQAYMPEVLRPLGPELLTHSSAHHHLTQFSGRKVLVVGGGASGTDLAALLSVAGASVELVSRHQVKFHQPPHPGGRPWWQRLRRPHFGLGPSLRSTAYTLLPGLFRQLPPGRRLRIVRQHLGPAGAWFVRDLIQKRQIPLHQGFSVRSVTSMQGLACVKCLRPDGSEIELRADHVIAATGYRVALEKLPYLDPGLRKEIRTLEGYPVLSRCFESSAPGLYFVGLSAAGSFGPLLRFALGARFAAQRLSAHLGALADVRAATPADASASG